MKSELLGPDHLRVRARQPIHRGRMSKLSAVNGASEDPEEQDSVLRQVNLAAAFHDHISCTKSADLCPVQEERMTLPCETDHIYANCSDKNATRDERWKDMLLLQLDLIQHQQEQLLKKDRQLLELRQDRDALKLRLERMERRVALIKRQKQVKDDDSSDDDNAAGSSSSVPSPSSFTPEMPATRGAAEKHSRSLISHTSSSRELQQERRQRRATIRAIKRRIFNYSQRSPNKQYHASRSISSSLSSSSPSSSSTSKSSVTPTHDIAADSTSSSVISRSSAAPQGSFSQTSARQYTRDSATRVGSKSRGLRGDARKKEAIMTTDHLYYLPVGETLHPTQSPLRDETIQGTNLEKDARYADTVTMQSVDICNSIWVPSWRYHPVSSCYQLEGTENIDDDVFSRRHGKLEVDERRRKRWDIQKIREQRMNEKLRQGRSLLKVSQKGKSHFDIRSFYPEPKDVHYIDVTDTVPVVAFGQPIPKFQVSDFSVPWFDPELRDKQESQNKGKKQRNSSSSSSRR